MTASEQTNSPIIAAYRERTPTSAALAGQARGVFPSGLTHDSRRILPYGIYVERAQGARKWDADGNEYVDYYGGHGALLLGHGRAEVVEAVQAQMARGTHFGACHELEVRWGGLVREMVPSAETVRFTSSGTEANLMALRLARAFTGRRKVVRFFGHFHGWHDHVAFGVTSHFDGTASPGVLAEIAASTRLLPAGDLDVLRRTLQDDDDIAAVILEPTGASSGQIPVDGEFLRGLREATEAHGVILIFDEVVTGFRVSPGGAQAHFGVTPDLTSLAKILAGGLPGGAITGRADVLELLDFDAAEAKGFEKIGHQGTYNANPLSASAGIAALPIIRDSDACERANRLGGELRRLWNDVIADEGVDWACHGAFSSFYLFLNPQGHRIDPHRFDAAAYDHETFKAKSPIANKLRLALLVNGVDVSGKPGGSISAAHDEADLRLTAEALRAAIGMLRAEGDLPAAGKGAAKQAAAT
ncbi:MAG: aspartate aminotransferase family protein [Alphaproteobacteria bacterium]|nr:aspartate aminotransferase family protein [Alphaproteobacteria bacterium]